MITRTGDAAQAGLTMDRMRATQTRMREQEMAIATGKGPRSYAEISDETATLLRTKEAVQATGALIRQNELAITRLNAADSAMSRVGDHASRIQTLLVQRLNGPTGDMVALDAEVDVALADAVATLNLRVDGRHLFAGTRTDARPFEVPAVVNGPADLAGVYRGDERATVLRVDRGAEVEVDLNGANFVPFLELLAEVKAAHTADDDAALHAAADKLDAQIRELSSLRGKLGTAAARIEGVNESHRSTNEYLGQLVSDIEDTDLPAAMTKLAQDRTTMEATYSVIASLSRLSLNDYLR